MSFSEGQGKASHGSIDLKDCLTVKSAEEKTKKKYSFEVATPESTYYMYASSEKEKDVTSHRTSRYGRRGAQQQYEIKIQ